MYYDDKDRLDKQVELVECWLWLVKWVIIIAVVYSVGKWLVGMV